MNVEVSNHMQALEADQIKELDKNSKQANQLIQRNHNQNQIKTST